MIMFLNHFFSGCLKPKTLLNIRIRGGLCLLACAKIMCKQSSLEVMPPLP